MSGKKLPPIRKSIDVHVPPARAFDVFVRKMHDWWPAEYTPFPRSSIVIEPKADGRWYEKGIGGEEGNTGKVVEWQAPNRVVLAWQIDGTWKYDPKLVTEVEVRFTSDGNGGTHVALEHRDLDRIGELAEPTQAMMDGDEGWSALLKRYAAAVKGA